MNIPQVPLETFNVPILAPKAWRLGSAGRTPTGPLKTESVLNPDRNFQRNP